jgi:hypothetical protein
LFLLTGIEMDKPLEAFEIQVESSIVWSKIESNAFPMTQFDLEKVFDFVSQKIEENKSKKILFTKENISIKIPFWLIKTKYV